MKPDRPARFAFVSALVTIAVLVTASPAPAVSLPDLAVSVLSTHAARVVRGHAFGVASTVKNLGQGAAAASTERFYLSADRLRGAGDRRMIQVRQIARLNHNATSAGTTSLKPAMATPEGIYYVVACADDLAKVRESNERNNCRTTATRVNVVAGATSADLIDMDLTAGTITPDQAMLYRVFAAYGDSRLPPKYHGDDGSQVDTAGALTDAVVRFDTASPSLKRTLEPFLKAPAYPGTWEELPTARTADSAPAADAVLPLPASVTLGRDNPIPHPSTLGEPGWDYYQTLRARIWFREGAQHDEAIARFIYFSLDDIWDKESELMGAEPRPDGGAHPYVDAQGNTKDWGGGGSDDLDIYLNDHLPPPAATSAYPPDCTDTSSYIQMNPDKFFDLDGTRDVLAHEFMHVLQFLFHYSDSCGEYHNLEEATAQWAVDFVYHQDNLEHRTDKFLPNPGTPLWQSDYDGWPFFMFLSQTVDPDVIFSIFTQTESHGPWAAVDEAIPGGFAEQWKKFALKAWNQPPETDSFKQWDALADVPRNGAGNGPVEPERITLGGQHRKEFPAFLSVPALTRDYTVYDIAPDVGKVEYRNGLDGISGASVQALVKLKDGTWKDPQDWTDRDSITFCRAKPAEDVVKLVVIIGDSTSDDLGHALSTNDTKLVATSDCLPDTYTGTFSGHATVSHEMLVSWTGNATYERADPSFQQSCQPFICYVITTGTVTWDVGTAPGAMCTYHSDPKVSPLATNAGAAVVEASKGQDGVQTYSISGGPVNDSNDGTITCGDDSGPTTFFPYDCCFSSGSPQPEVGEEGYLLAGTHTETSGDQGTSTWSFQGH